MIKFFDLHKNDKKLHPIFLKKLKNLLKNGDYILGNETKKFEKSFSKFVNSNYAVGCGNGTDALILALKSLKLSSNSEVILPAMTYCSTYLSVVHANLKPVLVDIERNKPTIDLIELKKKINKKTKVILPVHLYGSAINNNEIKDIINKFDHKIYLIDDCAQAHGSLDDNRKKIGSTSDISCFSLYPGKNLGAYGDAGILTTNNKNIYNALSTLRNLGSNKKYSHTEIGLNSRLDTIQSLILNLKLPHLKKSNEQRRKIANKYDAEIINPKIKKLKYSKYAVYHQYIIISDQRNELTSYLDKNNIQYGFHYPKAIHQLEFYSKKNKECYPNSEILASNGLSLPIDPKLKKKEIKYIIDKLNSF